MPGIWFFDEIRALEQKPAEESESAHVVEEMTRQQDVAPGQDSYFSGKDPACLVFADVVKKHWEFDLQEADHKWFAQRVVEKFFWQSLNLLKEVRNWEDWLSIENWKKSAGKANKFPRSNFKGSFLNWLKLTSNSDEAFTINPANKCSNTG